MTQHKDHVKNLYNSPMPKFSSQNRYHEVLPCKSTPLHCFLVKHSRVILKDTREEAEFDTPEEKEIIGYINASFINVCLSYMMVQTLIRG